MIGQHLLQSRIDQLIENDTFPRFTIFVGPKGSGKKTLAHLVYQKFGAGVFSNIGVSVDAVRQCIAQSYAVRGSQAIYLLADADNMSNAAKNALLKVTEEPPNNAYFIMTLEDEGNTLETIISRATVFRMNAYKSTEIGAYFYDKYHANHDESEEQIVCDICETPGEVDTLVSYGISDFYDYVQLVIDNIAEVSLANSFKIASKVALKDTDEGYDLRLFWKAFINIVIDRAILSNEPLDVVSITSRYLQKLRIRGINKQMLIDSWILEVRDAWS